MIKKTIKEVIKVPQEVDIEVWETSDGRQFKIKEIAEEHEKIGMLKKYIIQSEVINNKYLTQYIDYFQFVYFENKNQVKVFEQFMCDNKDENTWGSWINCKEKFKFPCWIMCYYIPHNLSNRGNDDYTAIYMTPEEVKSDLLNVIEQIDNLK